MLSTNAILNASIIETPDGEENIIKVSNDDTTYLQSDISWVMDYYGPTGRPSKYGMIRKVESKDFDKIIENNLDFKIQKSDSNELILHYIQKPE
jgi:hypothetical protein